MQNALRYQNRPPNKLTIGPPRQLDNLAHDPLRPMECSLGQIENLHRLTECLCKYTKCHLRPKQGHFRPTQGLADKGPSLGIAESSPNSSLQLTQVCKRHSFDQFGSTQGNKGPIRAARDAPRAPECPLGRKGPS